MQSQNNRNCKTCGKPITSGDPRQKYCGALCYRGGELKIDYLKRIASAAVPGVCVEWPWSGDGKAAGYGKIRYENRGQLVHRVSYKLFVGPLDDECALHKCDNRPCFNPHHLFKGSYADNSRDRDEKGRGAHGLKIGKGKLTPDQVNAIRLRWIPNDNARALGKEFGIKPGYVIEIAKGLHQKYVPWPEGTSPDDPHRQVIPWLPQQIRDDIRARWIPRFNAGALAREYGITVAHVYLIARQGSKLRG